MRIYLVKINDEQPRRMLLSHEEARLFVRLASEIGMRLNIEVET